MQLAFGWGSASISESRTPSSDPDSACFFFYNLCPALASWRCRRRFSTIPPCYPAGGISTRQSATHFGEEIKVTRSYFNRFTWKGDMMCGIPTCSMPTSLNRCSKATFWTRFSCKGEILSECAREAWIFSFSLFLVPLWCYLFGRNWSFAFLPLARIPKPNVECHWIGCHSSFLCYKTVTRTCVL